MPEPIISVSGLRGIVGQSLTPEVAMRYVAAFAAVTPPGPMVVTRDSRASGEMLADAVHAALRAVGRNTIDAGIAPTPTIGVLIRHRGAAGGIQITASHNPSPYNGLKLLSSAGRVIPAGPGQEVLDQYRTGRIAWVGHDMLGVRRREDSPYDAHLELVLATVNVAAIRSRRFKVLLDANHGAGGQLGRLLLDALGCRVNILGEEPSGAFAHPPEPTAENLSGVLSAVTEAGVDVGFCQDPDADRLAVVDEQGRYIGEEYTLVLCVEHVLRERRGPIVINCASSRMTEDLTDRCGVPLIRAAVGEANVVDAMIEQRALYGGEGNGGPIDPRVGLIRDSFVGMAQILDAMAAGGLPVSRMADVFTPYQILKTKIDLPAAGLAAALDALERRFADARPSRLDGLRLDWPGRWLLVRASNTEPIVRAIAEAPTADEARRLCDTAAATLAELS